jgi:curli biogenesis system outer membrane secretion channel CsgG
VNLPPRNPHFQWLGGRRYHRLLFSRVLLLTLVCLSVCSSWAQQRTAGQRSASVSLHITAYILPTISTKPVFTAPMVSTESGSGSIYVPAVSYQATLSTTEDLCGTAWKHTPQFAAECAVGKMQSGQTAQLLTATFLPR